MTSTSPAQAQLDILEDLTRDFARKRETLQDRLRDLEHELTYVKRRRLRGIRSALALTQDAQAALESQIANNPDLFVRPRTITIDGVKVGLAKGKGKVEWDDVDRVVALIDRHFGDQADTLVKVTRTPVRAALSNLTIAELKKIGCRVEETGDQIVIKPQDSELDKLVNRLLSDTQDLEAI